MKKHLSIFIMIVIVIACFTACGQDEKQTPETGNKTIENTATDNDISKENIKNNNTGSEEGAALVDTWQTEDGDFIYEMLADGTLHVTSQYGTDEGCSWKMEGNTIRFSFSDGAGITYLYNTEKDILECEDDPSWYLVRSQG